VRRIAFQYRGKIPLGAAVLPCPRGIVAPLKQGGNLFLMCRTWGAIRSQRSTLSRSACQIREATGANKQ
jgi:hypothetical protein